MSNVMKGIKYVFDKIVDLIRYIIDASKLTLIKLKVLLFIAYMALFSFNYFIDAKSQDGQWSFRFDPQNIPTSSILITAIVVIFLTTIDFVHAHLKMYWLTQIAKSEKTPTSLKKKAIDEILKTK